MTRIAPALALLLACRPAPAEVTPEPAPAPQVEAAPDGAAAETPPAPSFTLDEHRLVLPVAIAFAAGGDAPTPESEPAIEHFAAYMQAKDGVTRVRIESHTDGPDAQALSVRRAMAVARRVVSKGVDCKRLVAVGFGASKPIEDPATPEGRARNERVEAVNAALRGRAIGGMPEDGGGQVTGDPCTGP